MDPAGNDTEPSEDVQRQIEDLQRSLEDVRGGMTELEDRLNERTDRLSEDITRFEDESGRRASELEDHLNEKVDRLKEDVEKNADAIAELQGGNETLIGKFSLAQGNVKTHVVDGKKTLDLSVTSGFSLKLQYFVRHH